MKAPSAVLHTSTGCTGAILAKQPSTTGIPTDECAVLVWASRTSKMQVVFFSKDLNLDASSVSRFERDCP